MDNGFGKYQELVNNWAKKKDMVFVLPEFLDLFKQIEKEGRVDFLNSVEFKNLIQSAESKSAIAELRFYLKELNSWKGYKIAFKDGVQNIERTNFFNQIKNNLKKRLKELQELKG